MTPAKVFKFQTPDWKLAIAESFRDRGELLEFCEIDSSGLDLNRSEKVRPETGREAGPGHDFPLRVTRYFASLIEKGNALDPLLLQVLPDARELETIEGYSKDPVGDRRSMPVAGLIHKYHGRVLLTLTGACPIHCRYCFRRHFPYQEATVDYNTDGEVMKYLSRHKEIREVILSGGDPLMLSDQKLAKLIVNLNQVAHIRLLRIHSRLLSVLPQRVTETFIETLKQFNGKIILVTHINHPHEITEFNHSAFQLLSQQGFTLLNQAVLLKQINNSAQTLVDLSYKLFAAHIMPYYLHRLDKVQGAAHFDLPAKESHRIYRKMRSRLPGYLLPELVEEIAGRPSKTRCIK